MLSVISLKLFVGLSWVWFFFFLAHMFSTLYPISEFINLTLAGQL